MKGKRTMKTKLLSCILTASIALTGAALPSEAVLEETPVPDTVYSESNEATNENVQETQPTENDDADIPLETENSENLDEAQSEIEEDETVSESEDLTETELNETEKIGSEESEKDLSDAFITEELAVLLATNQADSIMGSFGITRSSSCQNVIDCFEVAQYINGATLDENYMLLWEDLNATIAALSQNRSAHCVYQDGVITVLS